MKITILFLGKIGAGPRYSFEMANALSENAEISLQIILSSYVDNINEWEILAQKSNVKIVYFKTYRNKFEFLLSIINFRKFQKISEIINSFKPVALYIPMISLLNPGILFFLKKIKIYYTLHDPIEHIGEKNIFVEQIRKYELKKSAKVILLNTFFKNYVSSNYRIKEENILVIPHASFFSKNTPSLNMEYQNKFLFVGRIEKYKGIDLLLDAFSLALEQKEHLHLTIAGRGDISPYALKIDKLAKNLTIDNRWLSNQEVDSLIRNHDFVVLPYIDASQSGVVPVVFANMRTVIVTNTGALAEQVPDQIGFVVNANTDELATKILNIYKGSCQELNEKNLRAYNFAKENLTWEASAKILINNIKLNY